MIEIRISTVRELIILFALLRGEYDEVKELEKKLETGTDALQDSINHAQEKK